MFRDMNEGGLSQSDKEWIREEVKVQIDRFKDWVREEVAMQISRNK
jgi:hypothetical protein